MDIQERLEWWRKMKAKIQFNEKEFEKKLRAAAETAIESTIKNEVIPIVKDKLSKKAKNELQNISPSSRAVLSSDPKAIKKYNDTKKGIKRTMSSESYINNTDLTKNVNSWESTIYYNVAPDEPIWKWNNGSANSVAENGELFAQWIVDGKLVIHPALSQYRGKIMDGTDFQNPYFDVIDENYSWNQYKRNYSFKQIPFVDHTMKELNKDKNFISDVQKCICDKINKELKK